MTTTEQVPDAVPAPTDITITAMEPEEYPLLAEFLYQAIHVPPGTPTPDRSVVELPELRGIRTVRRRLHGCPQRAAEWFAGRGCCMGQNLPEQRRRLRHHRYGNARSLHILVSRLARPRHRSVPNDGVTSPAAGRRSHRSQSFGSAHQHQRPPPL